MFERARHDVGATAYDRLQGPRTTGEIQDFDVQAFIFKVTVEMGDRQRQIIDERLATHSDTYVFFLGSVGCPRHARQHASGACDARQFQNITTSDRHLGLLKDYLMTPSECTAPIVMSLCAP